MLSKHDYFRNRYCDEPTAATCKFARTTAIFLGDSITRELFYEASHIFDARKFYWIPLVSVHHLQNLTRGVCLSAGVSKVTGQRNTIVWVGGNAIHFLLRRQKKTEPIMSYVQLVAPVLSFLKTHCVNSIFVGPIQIDESLFLSPPKRDWNDFDDFSLLPLWHTQAKALATNHGVRYFDTQNIVNQHKKCRCDGMHFGSAYKAWNCTSSIHLWRHEMCRQISAHD